MKTPHDTDVDAVLPVFDQLPDDLQDAFLRAIALTLLDVALAELDDHDTVVVTTERKAG